LNLYYKKDCPFSLKIISFLHETNTLEAVQLLDCDDNLQNPHNNELESGGGKLQYPCLNEGEDWIYESEKIINKLKSKLNIQLNSPITDYTSCVFDKLILMKKKLQNLESSIKQNN
jgi:hypothetical protein